MNGRKVKSALRFNWNGRVNGSPHHFVCFICVRILRVTLDGALHGMLNIMLDGALDSALDRMLVSIAEYSDDTNAVFACDKSSHKLKCRWIIRCRCFKWY